MIVFVVFWVLALALLLASLIQIIILSILETKKEKNYNNVIIGLRECLSQNCYVRPELLGLGASRNSDIEFEMTLKNKGTALTSVLAIINSSL